MEDGALKEMTVAEYVKWRLEKRCEALGCEATATACCTSHGSHYCANHFTLHRVEWHSTPLSFRLAVAKC